MDESRIEQIPANKEDFFKRKIGCKFDSENKTSVAIAEEIQKFNGKIPYSNIYYYETEIIRNKHKNTASKKVPDLDLRSNSVLQSVIKNSGFVLD